MAKICDPRVAEERCSEVACRKVRVKFAIDLHISQPKQPVSAFVAAQAWQHQKDAAEDDSAVEGDDTDHHDALYHEEPQSSDYEAVETDEDVPSSWKAQQSALKKHAVANSARYQPVTLSTWQPSQDSIQDRGRNAVSVSIKPGESLLLVGVYDLEVQRGGVSLYGTALFPSSTTYRVYAHSTHAIPAITGFPSSASGPSILRVSSCENQLHRLRPASPLFGRINNEQYEASELTAHIEQPSIAYVQHSASDPLKRVLQPLIVPKTWTHSLEKVTRTSRSGVPRILVCGPKYSGKSTFARVLLNYLLSFHERPESDNSAGPSARPTVCYLDLDPGQPEFSPPCQISLIQVKRPVFGPPYTHALATPFSPFRNLRSHSIAATSPKEDIQHYLACAKDLFKHYLNLLRTFPMCPLIINTPGWIHGEGLDILTELIRSCEPSAVVSLGLESIPDEAVAREVTESLQIASKGCLFQTLESETGPVLNRTAADLRAMQYLSYFHSKGDRSDQQWTSKPIQQQDGISLSYDRENSDILAFVHLNDGGPAPDLWPLVLDEALVALISISDDTLASTLSTRTHPSPQHLPILSRRQSRRLTPFDPAKSHLVTLAYVKGLDVESRTITLVTPHAAQVYGLCHPELSSHGSDAGSDAASTGTDASTAHGPRLVVLQGFFDAPSWASMSAIHYRRHVQRERRRHVAATRPDVQAESELHGWLKQQVAVLAGNGGMEAEGKVREGAAWDELGKAGVGYLEPVGRRRGV